MATLKCRSGNIQFCKGHDGAHRARSGILQRPRRRSPRRCASAAHYSAPGWQHPANMRKKPDLREVAAVRLAPTQLKPRRFDTRRNLTCLRRLLRLLPPQRRRARRHPDGGSGGDLLLPLLLLHVRLRHARHCSRIRRINEF